MNDLIIVEQFYGFAYVSAWGGGREADADGVGRERVWGFMFLFILKTNLQRAPD